MRFVINPFDLYMVASGPTGALGGIGSGADGPTMATGSAFIDLSPSTMVGRFAPIASYFSQYRITRLRIQFKSALGSDGMIAGGNVTMTPAYINRTMAFGVYPDPDQSPSDYSDAVNFGARVTSVRNNASFNFRPNRDWMNGWRYTQYGGTTNASEIRMYSIGNFYCFYAEPSLATVANAMGNFIFTMDAEFRWPNMNTLAPSPLPPSHGLQDDGETKTPQSDTVVVEEMPPGEMKISRKPSIDTAEFSAILHRHLNSPVIAKQSTVKARAPLSKFLEMSKSPPTAPK